MLGIGGFLFLLAQGKNVWLQFEDGEQLVIRLVNESKQKTLHSWSDETEGKEYFFLPASSTNDIYIENRDKDIYIDGEKYRKGAKFNFENGHTYEFEIYENDESMPVCRKNIVFMKSENIPALFIDTDSGSMDSINEGIGDYQETGRIDVILADGRIEYSGKLEKISLRGNSTREYPKKPYSIRLKDAKPLCGMTSGKKWNLLACWREGTKMNDKLVFEMAGAMGLKRNVDSTWVDLYLNGEYNGIYLLCEAIGIENELEKDNEARNPNIESAQTFEYINMKGYKLEDGEDITGTYLLEKEYFPYYLKENNGFVTDYGNCFVIKSPQYASEKQVEYISGYVQHIENLIMDRNSEYLEYIDPNELAKRFLVDEITLNFDTGITSTYFYKERNDNVLHVGPVWDYDTALGAIAPKYATGETWNSYEYSVLYTSTGLRHWYQIMYENDEFYNAIVMEYKSILPYMENLINSKIDEYSNMIEASVGMNDVRWKRFEVDTEIVNAGHYMTFEANVKYLKYFLSQRLNFLNKRWEIDTAEFICPVSDEMHKVTFNQNGKQETISVKDGEMLTYLPVLDKKKYKGWYISYSGEEYYDKLPIFEDMELYAAERIEE